MASSTASTAPPKPWMRFVAGTASGIALVLVGHPLDLLRVRMQLGEASLVAATGRVFREGGLRGFYRGMVPPLLFTGGINTVLWGLTFSCTDWLAQRGVGSSATERAVLAAVPCGALISLLVTPMEGIKSRMQARGGKASMVAVVRGVVALDGWRGLYRGLSACALARASNYGYFGSNAAAAEWLAVHAPPPPGGSRLAQTRNTLLAGGCAGVGYWLVAMPFDVLKARMMAAPDGLRPQPTLFGAARQLYAESGPRGFVRGMLPAMLRAFPTNAATFLTFDLAMRQLQQRR